MSPEIILVAIGCYLFCGLEEKAYRLKTGDWKSGSIDIDFKKDLSEFSFTVNKTKYDQVLAKFGMDYVEQRTHRVIRKQKYNEATYYFNREVRYYYHKVQKLTIPVGEVYCKSDLALNLYFKDDLLIFYNIYDMRLYEDSCKQYAGNLHTLFDKSWLSGNENDPTNVYNCNEKFYRIFTLGHRSEWDNSERCDFHYDKTYWDDPVYKDREYIGKRTGQPCTGIFNTECKL